VRFEGRLEQASMGSHVHVPLCSLCLRMSTHTCKCVARACGREQASL